MKIKALEEFFDLEANKQRKQGEEFDVGEIRGKALTTTSNRMKRALCVVCADEKPKKATKKKEGKLIE